MRGIIDRLDSASTVATAGTHPVRTAETRDRGARPHGGDLTAVLVTADDEAVTPAAVAIESAFGDSWIDTDRNGCNQRDDVLVRDVPGTVRVAVQDGVTTTSGRTMDRSYTGRDLRFDDLMIRRRPRRQIDHAVPLAEAWVSGAAQWTDDRRRAFANDLAALLAVDGPTNASKRDGDPAAWRPKKAYQCDYAIRWIGVKQAWGLAVDESERRALTDMLGYCAS